MYNPDFWEIRLDPHDLDQYANEAGLWFETSEEAQDRLRRASRIQHLVHPLMEVIGQALTEKQRQVLFLYYLHQKTQEEVAQILGISRRVVSQHLFGICRNGKQVGGAIKKIRKLCRQRGIGL
jgi:RNA polymerase sigma factor (sigma-70 family)